MIKINKNDITIEGDLLTIMNEITIIIHTIIEEDLIPKDLLASCIKTGFMTKEEALKKAKKIIEEKKKQCNLDEFLSDIIGDDEDDI